MHLAPSASEGYNAPGRGEVSMDADKIISLVLGGTGTLTGVVSLIWHIVRSRHDRCEFRLSEFKVTYFVVPSGWKFNFIGEAARTAAPPPVGTWVHFSGRLINKGYQPGSVERIRVLLPPVSDDGEGAFPEGELRLPFHVKAHTSCDIRFRYHLSTDDTAVTNLPDRTKCSIILKDQAGHQHRSDFQADRVVTARFSVRRRQH